MPGMEFHTYIEGNTWDFVLWECLLFLCETVINQGYVSERMGGSQSTNQPFEVNTRDQFLHWLALVWTWLW